jgi:hypothetical protein
MGTALINSAVRPHYFSPFDGRDVGLLASNHQISMMTCCIKFSGQFSTLVLGGCMEGSPVRLDNIFVKMLL